MAVYFPHLVRCSCGNDLSVELADSVNVKRSPDVRKRILNGELHRVACPACKRQMTVEKPFYYTDLGRKCLFKVLPRGERHRFKRVSLDLERAAGFLPGAVSRGARPTLRVVFGMDELREKLVAQDNDLDDRAVELLKVLLVHEHPVLLQRPRLRLTLVGRTEASFQFQAAYEHDSRRFRLDVPHSVVTELTSCPQRLEAWSQTAHKAHAFALPDHWVSMWRWSPQPTALERLERFAKELASGRSIDTEGEEFRRMLKGLPRGAHLPVWAKRALREVYEHVKSQGLPAMEDELFEIRFGVALADDWSTNDDGNDIDTLWQLLKNLPDTNVEGNTKIHELLLVSGGGGLYDPVSGDITIGSDELDQRERFEDIVRHEVGHAVHELHDTDVTEWLQRRFGWTMLASDDAGIDRWVGSMGGWGTLMAPERRDVRHLLRKALGGGSSWRPGPIPAVPQQHPWNAAAFGPRLAFERTGEYWYKNHATWYRVDGRAFFLNYWYATLMVVDVATLTMVEKMPSSYAAMSPYEFFAELYALYHDLGNGSNSGNDSVIEEDVRRWLAEKVGAPEPGAPMPPSGGPPHWGDHPRA